MNGQQVLVTGAAGRLGSAVCGVLHGGGYEVVGTDIVEPPTTQYRFERGDLLDHEVALRLLDGVDAVFHIANHPGIGRRPPQVVFNENITMNTNIFQGAAERGVGRIEFASTLQLIGSHPDTRTVTNPAPQPAFPVDGDTVPQPSNLYALSKTVSETMLAYYAHRCGIDATALRLPLLHNNEETRIVDSGDETPVSIFEGFTGLTYHDAARLFLAVLKADPPGFRIYMAGTSHRHRDLTVDQLIERYYPATPPDTEDLIDMTAVEAETGWVLGSDYHRPSSESEEGTRT